VECEGITLVGELTGVNPDYTATYGEGDAAFVEAAQAVASLFPPLPNAGWLEQGTVYQHGGQAVIVRQAHNRTEHNPADVPALFLVYRADADVLAWIAGEQVYVGTQRTYGDVTYRCLQSHASQVDWTPTATLGVLWAVVAEEPPPGPAAWAVGVAYKIGDEVTYGGKLYRCRQAHTSISTWTPPAVLALWLPL
jgi:hypothetical protein